MNVQYLSLCLRTMTAAHTDGYRATRQVEASGGRAGVSLGQSKMTDGGPLRDYSS